MNNVYLSLGSNRGSREANLEKAKNMLSDWAGNIITESSIYETPPWKMADSIDFLNQVILLETKLSERELMEIIYQIETLLGRVRIQKKYEPRTIDVDILFFNDLIVNKDGLIIPHPLLQERRFVLDPLAEIAPKFIHPVFQKKVLKLLDECIDKSRIRKLVSK